MIVIEMSDQVQQKYGRTLPSLKQPVRVSALTLPDCGTMPLMKLQTHCLEQNVRKKVL